MAMHDRGAGDSDRPAPGGQVSLYHLLYSEEEYRVLAGAPDGHRPRPVVFSRGRSLFVSPAVT